jgi:hypothetical protein
MGYSKPRNPEPDQNLFGNDGSGTVHSENGSATLVFCMVVKGALFGLHICR